MQERAVAALVRRPSTAKQHAQRLVDLQHLSMARIQPKPTSKDEQRGRRRHASAAATWKEPRPCSLRAAVGRVAALNRPAHPDARGGDVRGGWG